MRLLTRLANLDNLQRKLRFSMLLLMSITLITVTCFTVGYEYYFAKRNLSQNLIAQSLLVADNIAAAIAFDDQQTAHDSLAALRFSPDVETALVVNLKNALFSHYTKPGVELDMTLANWGGRQNEFTQRYILLSQPIMLRDQQVGWLVIKASLSNLYKHMLVYLAWVFLVGVVLFLLGVLLTEAMVKTIVKPLGLLSTVVRNITSTESYKERVLLDGNDEFADLAHHFNTMLGRIEERDDRLQNLAYIDETTRLHNRHFFIERAEHLVSSSMQTGRVFCLMFLDLDRFKHVNDTLGHDAGDALLLQVANRIKALVRTDDNVCRLGGDEFAVLLSNLQSKEDAQIIAHAICKTISQDFILDIHGQQKIVGIGVSIGMAAYPEHGGDFYTLLRCADIAMYQAKAAGRGRYAWYTPEPSAQ